MVKVDTHIMVVMEMTVPEAKQLRDALLDFNSEHPTDVHYQALNNALSQVDKMQE